MIARNGPSINLDASCFRCAFCEAEPRHDDGKIRQDVFCTHDSIVEARPTKDRKLIGETWKTPDWCPLLSANLAKLLANRLVAATKQEPSA